MFISKAFILLGKKTKIQTKVRLIRKLPQNK